MILIIICGIALLGFTILSGYNLGIFSQSNLFNYFFLLLIMAMLVPFVCSMIRKMRTITEKLKKATWKLKNDIWNYNNNVFDDTCLKPLYDEYLEKLKYKNEEGNIEIEDNPVGCDISDYINISVLNTKINKPVCDIVSATLTGLGLLGTFVGLM